MKSILFTTTNKKKIFIYPDKVISCEEELKVGKLVVKICLFDGIEYIVDEALSSVRAKLDDIRGRE